MQLIIYTFQCFFIVLDVVVLLYWLRSFLVLFPFGDYIVRFLAVLMTPMWYPMQWLIKHSILCTAKFDLCPYLLIVVLTYLQGLCCRIMNIL